MLQLLRLWLRSGIVFNLIHFFWLFFSNFLWRFFVVLFIFLNDTNDFFFFARFKSVFLFVGIHLFLFFILLYVWLDNSFNSNLADMLVKVIKHALILH